MNAFTELANSIREITINESNQYEVLDESKADEIRELLGKGLTSLTEIGKLVGVPPQQVYGVKKAWLAKQGDVSPTQTASISRVASDQIVNTDSIPRTGTKSEKIRELILKGGLSPAEIARQTEATPTQVYGIINKLKSQGTSVDIPQRSKAAKAIEDVIEPIVRTKAKGRGIEVYVDDSIYDYLKAVETATTADIIDYLKTQGTAQFDDIDEELVNKLIYRRIHAQAESGGIVLDGDVYRLPIDSDDFDEDEPDFDERGLKDDDDWIGTTPSDDDVLIYKNRYKGKQIEDPEDYSLDQPWDISASRLGYNKRGEYESDEDDSFEDDY